MAQEDFDVNAYRVMLSDDSYRDPDLTSEKMNRMMRTSSLLKRDSAFLEEVLEEVSTPEVTRNDRNEPEENKDQEDEEEEEEEDDEEEDDEDEDEEEEDEGEDEQPANSRFERWNQRNPHPYTRGSDPRSMEDIVTRKIAEICPVEYRDLAYTETMADLQFMKSNGCEPPRPSRSMHQENQAEYEKMDRQVAKERQKQIRKCTYLIQMAAVGVHALCKGTRVDILKTDLLQSEIKKNVDSGLFDDHAESLGEYMRGSVFEHPLVAISMDFARIVNDAHQKQIEEEEKQLEKEQELRHQRNKESMRILQEYRQKEVAKDTKSTESNMFMNPSKFP
jgi:hypothetical protein